MMFTEEDNGFLSLLFPELHRTTEWEWKNCWGGGSSERLREQEKEEQEEETRSLHPAGSIRRKTIYMKGCGG